jgi:hypothetical protein
MEPTISDELVGEYHDLIQNIQDIGQRLKALNAQTKVFGKKMKRVTKQHDKLVAKALNKAKPRSLASRSGINKASPVTEELCRFMHVPAGTLVARTTATTAVNTYIKQHELQKRGDKRLIVLDHVLAALLRRDLNDEITFFDLPRHMNVHFNHRMQDH